MKTIADLLQSSVSLGKVSAKGFVQLKCPICHDYKERLGIKLTGSTIGANCFNCGFKARYDETDGRVSKGFRKLLLSLGVGAEEIDRASAEHFFKPKDTNVISLESLNEINLYTPEIKLPPLSYRIKSDNCPLENAYLASRKLSCEDYPLYASADKKLKNRIIIPFYKHGKLIYWQARTIVADKLRYKNCEVSKEAVMFNIDRLWFNSRVPLFITEGVLDAISLSGVSIIGSTINPAKKQLLEQSPRDLVFVVDPDKNGYNLAKVIFEYKLGAFTFLEKGMDVNLSIVKYGKLWTFYQLFNNIRRTNFEQKLFLANLKTSVGL